MCNATAQYWDSYSQVFALLFKLFKMQYTKDGSRDTNTLGGHLWILESFMTKIWKIYQHHIQCSTRMLDHSCTWCWKPNNCTEISEWSYSRANDQTFRLRHTELNLLCSLYQSVPKFTIHTGFTELTAMDPDYRPAFMMKQHLVRSRVSLLWHIVDSSWLAPNSWFH